MVRVNVGDMFKVKKHFSFCGVSYGVGERFKVISVYSASKVRGEFAISIQDMFNNRRLTIGSEVFGRYMKDGYFTKIKIGEEEVNNMNEQFKLEVGDIVQSKHSTFTIVKDIHGKFAAVDHEDFAMLPVDGSRITIEDEEYIDIVKVYRLSKISRMDSDWDESALNDSTQIYPKPKVKLTLSQIKKQFQIENEEVEIDFEN